VKKGWFYTHSPVMSAGVYVRNNAELGALFGHDPGVCFPKVYSKCITLVYVDVRSVSGFRIQAEKATFVLPVVVPRPVKALHVELLVGRVKICAVDRYPISVCLGNLTVRCVESYGARPVTSGYCSNSASYSPLIG
jgi:hypothetical protein